MDDGWLIGGFEPFRAVIVDYDPSWPVRFEVHAAELRAALGSALLSIEHVGSTSIPGLAAKPVIDIACAIADPLDEPSYVPDVEALGYELRARLPERRFFRSKARDVQVHFLGPEHPQLADYRVLRRQLLRSAEDRELYAATKRRLAERDWADMTEYTMAKSEVLTQILERGREPDPA